MTRFNVNTSYFQHSTPEYNRKHKEENSKYNHKYYEEHKEKWQDNDDEDDKKDESSESKSGSEKEEKDSKDGKSGSSSQQDKIKSILSKLNGGSKKVGSGTGKKKASSKTSKEKKTDEEKEEEKRKKEEEKEEEKRKKEEEKEKKLKEREALKERKERERLTKERRKKELEEEKKRKKAAIDKLSGSHYVLSVRGKKSSGSLKHSTVYVGINSQPYFEHHGRLGMKWGKRNGPPYPLDYSKLSEEERAKDKARVREEGDIESVAYKKNRSYFSDQEINDVINRYQLNQRINQLSADSAKMKAGKSKAEQMAEDMAKVADVGNKLSNALNAGTNVYNNVAKIMNAFGDSDLPIVGQAKPKKEFKATKKELDKMIENLETGMGNMTNQELQDALKRKTMYDSLVKDRNAARKEKGEQDVKYYNESEERKASQRDKILSGFHSEGKSYWEKNKNNEVVEHVTGEVVDAGHDWTDRTIYALEDKQRR